MGIKMKIYNCTFLLCLIYISTIQPAFSSVAPPKPPQCGQSKAASGKGSSPWIGLLGYGQEGSDAILYNCASSLLNPSTLATAAHCADEKIIANLRFVRLGAYDFSENANPEAQGIEYKIKKPILHPQYNPNTLENDIALLILEKPVEYSDSISPVCLPLSDDLKKSHFSNTSLTVTGWGQPWFGGPTNTKLNQTDLPVVEINTCKSQYSRFTNVVIDDRVICAAKPEGGEANCQGNIGGPMTLAVNNNHYLIGILSEAYNCDQPGWPGIYSRVGQHIDFILQNLA